MNFYKSKSWKRKRIIILKRDDYQCQECKRYGKNREATTVHHIIPLAWCLIFNKALALVEINLISLCHACHDKMHDRTNDKLTPQGLDWVRRKLGDLGLEWIEKYSKQSWK